MFIIVRLLFSIAILAFFTQVNAVGFYDLYKKRPPIVQQKIDELFIEISGNAKSDWTQNGMNKYYLCHVDDEKLISDIIINSPSEQREFYFVDVGAGGFQWCNNIVKFINSNQQFSVNNKYHIIGLNGEGKDEVEEHGKCTVYKLGGFKIENMLESFEKRKMYLIGKIDLMVSQWTLRHLVDPFGTFLQMHALMKTNGYMLLEGIPFEITNNKNEYIYGEGGVEFCAEHLLKKLKQSYLICPTNSNGPGRALRDIIIQKSDIDINAEINLTYSDILIDNGLIFCNACRYSVIILANDNMVIDLQMTSEERNFHGDKKLFEKLLKIDENLLKISKYSKQQREYVSYIDEKF